MIENDFKIDFVGIGAPKCATTWIYECLKEHPQIWMAPKDQREFSYFFLSSFNKKGIQQYKSLSSLADLGQIKGEFNVHYIGDPKVPDRIKNHNSNMRIIASLRDPVDRAYSHYLHHSSLASSNFGSFEQAIQEKPKLFIDLGFYYERLKKYFKKFPSENILVLIYKDISENPIEFIQDIYSFLKVDDSFVPNLGKRKVSPTKFKFTRLGKFIHQKITPALKNSTIGQKIHHSLLIRRYFRRFAQFYAKNESKPPMKKETRDYLRDIYREDILKLEKLINRDLSFWK